MRNQILAATKHMRLLSRQAPLSLLPPPPPLQLRRPLVPAHAPSHPHTSAARGVVYHNCPYCFKSFQHKTQLHLHLRTHAQAMPLPPVQLRLEPAQAPAGQQQQGGGQYPCLECPVQFSRKDSMKRHCLKVHKMLDEEFNERVKNLDQ